MELSKRLPLMKQTTPCCFGASVAVTTSHIRNGAFHTEHIKAGLGTDHSWTHFSTSGWFLWVYKGLEGPINARKCMQKERSLTKCTGVATALKTVLSWCDNVGQINLNIMLQKKKKLSFCIEKIVIYSNQGRREFWVLKDGFQWSPLNFPYKT